MLHRRCSKSAYCGVNRGTLSVENAPYAQLSLLYFDNVNGCDCSVLRSYRLHLLFLPTRHRCCYVALRVNVLYKYSLLPVGVGKNDILDTSRLPPDFDLTKVLGDLLAETSNVEHSDPDGAENGPLEKQCGRNAPCCSGVETQLWKLNSLKGLACKTNITLNFYVLDSTRYGFLLRQAGVVGSETTEKPRLFILDQFSRTHHVMNEEIQFSNIGICLFCFYYQQLCIITRI